MLGEIAEITARCTARCSADRQSQSEAIGERVLTRALEGHSKGTPRHVPPATAVWVPRVARTYRAAPSIAAAWRAAADRSRVARRARVPVRGSRLPRAGSDRAPSLLLEKRTSAGASVSSMHASGTVTEHLLSSVTTLAHSALSSVADSASVHASLTTACSPFRWASSGGRPCKRKHRIAAEAGADGGTFSGVAVGPSAAHFVTCRATFFTCPSSTLRPSATSLA